MQNLVIPHWLLQDVSKSFLSSLYHVPFTFFKIAFKTLRDLAPASLPSLTSWHFTTTLNPFVLWPAHSKLLALVPLFSRLFSVLETVFFYLCTKPTSIYPSDFSSRNPFWASRASSASPVLPYDTMYLILHLSFCTLCIFVQTSFTI